MKPVFVVRAVYYSPGDAASIPLDEYEAVKAQRPAHAFGVYELSPPDGRMMHVQDFSIAPGEYTEESARLTAIAERDRCEAANA